MNKYEKEEIDKLEKVVLEELNKLSDDTSVEERAAKTSILYRLHQVLSNFDELEPTFVAFFAEKETRTRFSTPTQQEESRDITQLNMQIQNEKQWYK